MWHWWCRFVCYHRAFENLNPLFFTFPDAHVHAHGVAGEKFRIVESKLLSFNLFDLFHVTLNFRMLSVRFCVRRSVTNDN